MFVQAGTKKWHVVGSQHPKGTITACGHVVKVRQFSDTLKAEWLGDPRHICSDCWGWYGEEYQAAAQ